MKHVILCHVCQSEALQSGFNGINITKYIHLIPTNLKKNAYHQCPSTSIRPNAFYILCWPIPSDGEPLPHSNVTTLTYSDPCNAYADISNGQMRNTTNIEFSVSFIDYHYLYVY